MRKSCPRRPAWIKETVADLPPLKVAPEHCENDSVVAPDTEQAEDDDDDDNDDGDGDGVGGEVSKRKRKVQSSRSAAWVKESCADDTQNAPLVKCEGCGQEYLGENDFFICDKCQRYSVTWKELRQKLNEEGKEVSCPRCTFLNKAGAEQCEICSFNFDALLVKKFDGSSENDTRQSCDTA